MSSERHGFREIRGHFGTMRRPNLKSQRGRILQRLLRGDEVPAPELARIGGLQFQAVDSRTRRVRDCECRSRTA